MPNPFPPTLHMAAVLFCRFSFPCHFSPIFGISRFSCCINHCFTISSFKSTAKCEGEKHLNQVTAEVSNDFSEDDLQNEDMRALKSEYEIPHPKGLNLYEYVKKLEKTLTTHGGKRAVLKKWSHHLKYNKLKISAAIKSDSPRFIGLTTDLLEQRLNFLAQIGIKGRNALMIALEFPAILSWDSPCFTEMLKVLKDLNCDMLKLMSRTPYVFGLDHSRATENIHKLINAGVTKDTIGKLVSVNPLILSFPLRDEPMEIITLLLDSHKNVQSFRSNGVDEDVNEQEEVLSLLVQSLEKFNKQVNLQDNFKQVICFLQEMQVSPLIIGVKNPMIFSTDIDTLNNALDFFRGKPLLLEMEVIQHLLVSRPDIFVNFASNAITNRVQFISDVVQNPTVLYGLVQTRFLFDVANATVEDVIQWFQDRGIDDKEIANMVSSKNFFYLDKKELTERLQYLLSVDGVMMEDIRKSPACLLKPLTHLKERVEFLKAENPDVLNDSNLEHIMISKTKRFAAEICASTPEHFTEFVQSLAKEEV